MMNGKHESQSNLIPQFQLLSEQEMLDTTGGFVPRFIKQAAIAAAQEFFRVPTPTRSCTDYGSTVVCRYTYQ